MVSVFWARRGEGEVTTTNKECSASLTDVARSSILSEIKLRNWSRGVQTVKLLLGRSWGRPPVVNVSGINVGTLASLADRSQAGEKGVGMARGGRETFASGLRALARVR